MSSKRISLFLISALAIFSLGASVAHATTQEAFVCTFKEGKSIEDLMKVASEFKQAIADVKGGSDYQAQVMVPIASQDMNSVIWIGRMSDFASMAAFNDAYAASGLAKKFDPKFEALTDCESRSFWQVQDVK